MRINAFSSGLPTHSHWAITLLPIWSFYMFPNKHWLILFACFQELQIKLHHDRKKRRHSKHNDGLSSISLYPSHVVSGLGSQSGGQPGGAGVQGHPGAEVQGHPRWTIQWELRRADNTRPCCPSPSPLKKPIRASRYTVRMFSPQASTSSEKAASLLLFPSRQSWAQTCLRLRTDNGYHAL